MLTSSVASTLRRLLTLVLAVSLALPAAGALAATDPYAVHQWGNDIVAVDRLLPVEDGVGVTVAVIDSGIDGSHPELAGRIGAGWSAFGDAADAWTDPLGHGTGVAGVIAAAARNGAGTTGLADGVTLLSARVAGADGLARPGDVADGIRWATDQGAQLINISLTTSADDAQIRDAITAAIASGVVVVASAGNHGHDGNATMYPAAYDGVIGVAALDERLQTARDASHGHWVDLAAPGVGIFTLAPDAGYDVHSGGSFAAPHVTAAAAALASSRLGLTPAGAIDALIAAATDLGPEGRDDATGAGLLDLADILGDPVLVTATDPVERAVALSQLALPDAGAARVVLTSAAGWADALAASALAGPETPILMTPTDQLADATAAELARVLPLGGEVLVIGGTAVVSDAVTAAISQRGWSVTRLAGSSRIDTALAVAEAVDRGAGAGDTVFLASAHGWADAVAAGVPASQLDRPILLTDADALPASVADHLQRTGVTSVVIVGGTGVIADGVVEQLRAAGVQQVERIAGATRVATSAAIAERYAADAPGLIRIPTDDALGWVSGLAAVPLGWPVLLVDPQTTPTFGTAAGETATGGTPDSAPRRTVLISTRG